MVLPFKMDFSVDLVCSISGLLQAIQDLLPDTLGAPTVEAARYRIASPIPSGQIVPRRTRAVNPQNAVDDCSMVSSRLPSMRFCRQQGVKFLPLSII